MRRVGHCSAPRGFLLTTFGAAVVKVGMSFRSLVGVSRMTLLSSIRMMREACEEIELSLVERMIVVPLMEMRFRSSSRMVLDFRPRFLVGFSTRRILGSFATARARQTRCFWISESWCGKKYSRLRRPKDSRMALALCRLSIFFIPEKRRGRATFSIILYAGSRSKSEK